MEDNMNVNVNANANQTTPIAVASTVKVTPEVVAPSPYKPTPVEVPASATAPVPQAVMPKTDKIVPEAVVYNTSAGQPPVSQVPTTSAGQPTASDTPAAQSIPAPALNSSMINPMPEKVTVSTVPANEVTPGKNDVKANTEEMAKEEKKASQKKEKKGLGALQTVLISAAVGLIFGIIGTVGMFFIQKNTTVLDKLFNVGQTTNDVTVADTADTDVADGTGDATVDTDTDIDNTTPSTNSFNTAYTTVITGESDVITVTENAMPSMVTIIKEFNYVDSTLTQYFGNYTQGQSFVTSASGSGFIIAETDTEYLIVSNNHVVENPISLTVTFADGKSAYAYIKGCDKGKDIAVIAVLKDDVSDETVDEIRIASIGDSNNLRLGEQVVAIGNALGYGQSVTTGIISALNREMETEAGNVNKFIQTDAAINPGNSGGALLNMAGQVIGINSNKLAETSVEGMGYAIPISDVTDIIEELMEHSTKIPLPDEEVGYIGINLQEVTESLSQRFSMPVGIYIVEIVDGGAAEAAGLQAGDIITEFDGEKITSYDELDSVLQCYAAGTTVTIKYMRQEDGEYVEHTTDLTLGTKP